MTQRVLKTVKDVRDILNILTKNGIDAFVAGGWVRDMFFGIEPKDIDIFVNKGSTAVSERVNVEHILNSYQYASNGKWYPNYEHNDMRDDVEGVIKYVSSGLDIVLMKTDTIEDVISNFDVSICQIYAKLIDGKLMMFASKDFMDWGSRKLIYQYTDIPTSDSHLERVRAKFNTELVGKKSGGMVMMEIGEL